MHLEHHFALRDTEKLGARHNWLWGNSGINLEKNKPLWMVLFAAEPQATNCVHLKCTIDEESMCKREREGGREREGESEGDHTVNARLLWQIRSASLSRSEQFFGSERRAAKKKKKKSSWNTSCGAFLFFGQQLSEFAPQWWPSALSGLGVKEDVRLPFAVALSAGLTSHGDMSSVDPSSNKLLTFNQR